MEAVIEKDQFDVVTLENVPGIFRLSPITDKSDSDYIEERLRDKGFWTTTASLDNKKLGANADRHRWWLVAIRNLQGNWNQIDIYFHDIIKSCLMDEEMFEQCSSIDFNEGVREQRAEDLGLRTLRDCGERFAKRGEKEDPTWKDVHYDYFLKVGYSWPPKIEASPYILKNGLRRRELEVIWLCDSIWPQADDSDTWPLAEYLDVSPKIEMILQSSLITDKDTGNFIAKKSPWRSSPRTTVGGTKLILRYKEERGDDVVIRATEASEYMRLIGWDDSQWSAPAHGIHTKEDKMYFTELCGNFTGNAWSAWHFLPIKMATAATQYYFSKENALQQPEPNTQNPKEAMEPAQDLSSSSCCQESGCTMASRRVIRSYHNAHNDFDDSCQGSLACQILTRCQGSLLFQTLTRCQGG